MTAEELEWRVKSLHDAITEAPSEFQAKVHACYYELRHWLLEHKEAGHMAFSLINSELEHQAMQAE